MKRGFELHIKKIKRLLLNYCKNCIWMEHTKQYYEGAINKNNGGLF